MECSCLKTIYILMMFTVIKTFDLKCPEDLERKLRRKYVCAINISTEDRYSCLFDRYSNFYKESCKEMPDYVRPGQKYVLSGQRRNTDCSSLKYQPYKFWSNTLSQCVFEKSKCSGIGQLIFSNGSFMSDSTCGCDYTEGYAFVTEPNNKCFCIPTEEDCMCYLINCPRQMQLNQDYMCSFKENSSTFRCPPIVRSKVKSKAPTSKGKDTMDSKSFGKRSVLTGLIIYAFLTLIAIILFNYGMMGGKLERQTDNISAEGSVQKLSVIIEHLEQLLSHAEFDKDFQEELSAARPNYMDILQTYKRDLLRNDSSIVIAGETGAGKTTLINLLVGKNVFGTSKLAATGTVCRIRNSKSMSIKIYTKDEKLVREETANDLIVLKNLIKKYTDFETNPPDDVYLPVPIFKGNVLIVDTPGVGDDDNLRHILSDFLPHAVSFVFIINANNPGGINEDRLLPILKTVIDKRKEMPCFEPTEVIFLANQWDVIENIKENGDEEDQHTKTWNKIQFKLEEGWPSFHADRIFNISLEQVRKRQNTCFTRQFRMFQAMLDATIERNKNKRVEYYFRCIQRFAISAEIVILSRIYLLEISDEDRKITILKTQETVNKLATVSNEKMIEAKEYKNEIIAKLVRKLWSYLHSDVGRNDILNPPSRKRINAVPIDAFSEEVFTRINMGIRRWCESDNHDNVGLIIQEIESKVKTLLSVVESMICIIEEGITGFGRSIPGVLFVVFTGSALRMNLINTKIKTNGFVKILLHQQPLDCWKLPTEKQADKMYKAWLSTVTYDEIRRCFEDNFGTEYDRVISHIFEDEIVMKIKSVNLTLQNLLVELYENKKKTRSLTELKEIVNEIKTKIDDFKTKAQL